MVKRPSTRRRSRPERWGPRSARSGSTRPVRRRHEELVTAAWSWSALYTTRAPSRLSSYHPGPFPRGSRRGECSGRGGDARRATAAGPRHPCTLTPAPPFALPPEAPSSADRESLSKGACQAPPAAAPLGPDPLDDHLALLHDELDLAFPLVHVDANMFHGWPPLLRPGARSGAWRQPLHPIRARPGRYGSQNRGGQPSVSAVGAVPGSAFRSYCSSARPTPSTSMLVWGSWTLKLESNWPFGKMPGAMAKPEHTESLVSGGGWVLTKMRSARSCSPR